MNKRLAWRLLLTAAALSACNVGPEDEPQPLPPATSTLPTPGQPADLPTPLGPAEPGHAGT